MGARAGLTHEDKPGFWERSGYHIYGDPWQEERYWGDEAGSPPTVVGLAPRRRAAELVLDVPGWPGTAPASTSTSG